uniref:Uncharacterized protein n=1 Tax=Babesia bovis TaxID=5865 RepID=S6BK80_BABBO|nr:hypothetical protein [Babesia bovis]
MAITTGIPRTQSRKRSIAIVLYLTVATLCLSQVIHDVRANEVAKVQDTLSGSAESYEQTATSELNRPDDTVEDATSGTGKSLGYYQKYKQFVSNHKNKFIVAFVTLSAIFFVAVLVAITCCCAQESCSKSYAPIPILLGIGIFGFVLYKLYGQNVLGDCKNNITQWLDDNLGLPENNQGVPAKRETIDPDTLPGIQYLKGVVNKSE